MTRTTFLKLRLSASAMTGLFSGSKTSTSTVDFFGSNAPRHLRGRKAFSAVSAQTSEPIGKIGPCAE